MKPINFTKNSEIAFTLITNEEYTQELIQLKEKQKELNQTNHEKQLKENERLKEQQKIENSSIPSNQLDKLMDLQEVLKSAEKNPNIAIVGQEDSEQPDKKYLENIDKVVVKKEFETENHTISEKPTTIVQVVGNDLSLPEKMTEKSRQLLEYLQQKYQNKNITMSLELTGKHLGIMRFISNHFRIYSGNTKEVNMEQVSSDSDVLLSSSFVNSQEIEDFYLANPIENDMFLIKLSTEQENELQIPLNFESLIIQKDSKKNNKNKTAILTDILVEENSFDFFKLQELCSKDNYNLDCSLLIVDETLDSDEPIDTIEIFERKKYGR